ncbi:MAG: Na(+)-translocating NADH-quinone reductase subunit A [Planctomycetaceae bacterium]|nr:Na(+)-translocating NADH-quinone reductase subunit A [Planctomycetaceae bacterium]
MAIRIRRGLDLPIAGVPDQAIEAARRVSRVALVGPDYVGMKPTMLVQEGDRVKLGQPLFEDKKTEGVRYTAPACGVVREINRGEKRVFESIVVELEGDDQETFPTFGIAELSGRNRQVVQDQLLKSGLWTAIRRRPFSKVALPTDNPHAICVQAIDTNPLAPFPGHVIDENQEDFRAGLVALTRLTEGLVHLCIPPGLKVPGGDPDTAIDRVQVTTFDGPHPAGLAGTHIHKLAPVGLNRTSWYVNYQDVIAIGRLFTTGKIWTERVISLAGPQVKKPRLLRTRIGACIDDLIDGELADGDNRVLSGSVLHGRIADGPFAYLGRYDLQISALKEGGDREFLGWQKPGLDKFSIKPIFASAMAADGRRFSMTTTRNGSRRAIVPIGAYEEVMPLDIEPTYLLRSLVIEDTDQASALGALELDEEDLALCTFVDPGKHDFGPYLRKILTVIEREG